MSGTLLLRQLVNKRLAAAAEEIFGLVERTIAEYQDEAARAKREICQLREQLEKQTKAQVAFLKTHPPQVSENQLPSLQQCDIKVEEIIISEETELQPQVKEEPLDHVISLDFSNTAEVGHFKSELETNCELSSSHTPSTESVSENHQMSDCDGPCSPPHSCSTEGSVEQEQPQKKKKSNYFFGMDFECVQEIQQALPELKYSRLMAVIEYLATEVGITKTEDLVYVEEEDLQSHLTAEQCCKATQTFRKKVFKDINPVNSGVHHEQTPSLSSADSFCKRPHHPGPSSIGTLNSWINNLEIPFDKLPASLSQAVARGTKAYPADIRAMVRAVVDVMQKHCPNPSKSACIEVAKMLVSKYPGVFSDMTEGGEVSGKSFFSLVYKLKTRVEHVNRDSKHKTK
ncbi:uncharacterized protein LOC121510757 [Cheilinus undulatus]|uniref:uncharacterized protein LOC121510757 n=1 Tax=Cheilinus undulatus TaxID=241271 RepID=UPI001BD5A98D|nr:uncharacterized protein LOC121510757 [Cheilinus undulatus]